MERFENRSDMSGFRSNCCSLCSEFVNLFARLQHLFEMAAKSIAVDSDFRDVSCPVPMVLFQFRPKCNHLISSWFLPPASFIELRPAFLSCEA